MSGFRRDRTGTVAARLSAVERRVLRDVVLQVRELVGGPERPDPFAGLDRQQAEAPDDPVLARLLPDAYRDDAEAASEFRRFAEDELRAQKVRDALAVVADLDRGGDVRLAAGQERAEAWLRALNDARLALGTRLQVGEDSFEEMQALPRRSSRRAALELYHWLGYLQETLLEALDG